MIVRNSDPNERAVSHVASMAVVQVQPELSDAALATGYLVRNWYALNPNEWMRANVEHTGRAARILDIAGIVANRNTIPGDTGAGAASGESLSDNCYFFGNQARKVSCPMPR